MPRARWIADTDEPDALLPPLAGGESCATAPAAANAIVTTAKVTPARPRSTRRRRRACAPRRSCDARSDLRQGKGELRSLSIPTEDSSVVSSPTGLAVGLALDVRYAGLCRRFAPGPPKRPIGSPAPR